MPPVPPPPEVEVEVVVVHPPRLPSLGGEAVFAVEQLGAEALKAAPRLDAALKRAPGVSLFRRTGSEAANPTIQGLSLRGIAPSGAGRALVTLEGVPQNDPFGGWVIWSSLPPEGLGAATLVRGAGAGAYGAGALTGVVALDERAGGEGLSALELSAAERGGLRGAAALGAPNLLVTLAGETSDGYTPVRGALAGAADQPTRFDSLSASARLQGQVGDIDAAFRLAAYEERRGAGLAGASSVAGGGQASLTLAGRAADGGWRLQGWVRSSDLENASVAVAAGRARTTPANDQYATPALGYGFNAAWQRRGEAWSWELGADARFAEGRSKERFRFLSGAFTRGRETGGETAVGGVYAETVYEAGPWLVAGGARIDGWRQSGAVRIERDLASGAILLNQAAGDESGTTPTARLGARYQLGDGLWLRAAAYAGFRPPTLNELHRPFRVGNDVTEANPALKPETLQGIEAGLGGEAWSLTVFHNRLQDPVANVTVGFGPGVFPVAGFIPAGGVLRQRRNVGHIEAAGLELDWSGQAGPVALNAAASAVKAEVDGGSAAPQLTGKRPAQTPELTVTAGAAWTAGRRLSLSAQVRYEGERFEDDLNTRRLAAAVGFDARLAWRTGGGNEIYLAAENLTDARIEVGETGDGVESFAAPRTLRVGVSVRR